MRYRGSKIRILAVSSFAIMAFTGFRTPVKPNLLIIIVDQFRGQALGLQGLEPVHTPNLDQLGKESFTSFQMVSCYPVCSPSRACLMTGDYPLSTHVYANVTSASAPYGVQLPQDIICWSDVLHQNGYYNGYIGKWHLDSPEKPYVPTSNNIGQLAWNEWTKPARRHGFDYWYAYGTYDQHNNPMYWDTKAGRDSFHYVNEWGPQHEADKAIAYLSNKEHERDAAKPFSLVVSMNPPHTDYRQVPGRYYALYKDLPLEDLVKDPDIPPAGSQMGKAYRRDVKYYYACITGVDDQVGRIINYLHQSGLDDNTIVVFTSDHGNCLGKHNESTKNNMYEASMRVPLIIYWKNHIQPRLDSTLLISMPDLYPTLLDLMGLRNRIPNTVEGISAAGYLLDKEEAPYKNQFVMGSLQAGNPNSGFRSVRTAQYKLVYGKDKTGGTIPYLFDLKKDPYELTNMYQAESPVVQQLLPELKHWLKKTKDPFTL